MTTGHSRPASLAFGQTVRALVPAMALGATQAYAEMLDVEAVAEIATSKLSTV